MTEYLVKLGLRCEFIFDDIEEAAKFAKTAFRTRSDLDATDEIVIVIRDVKIKNKEVEEDDETDNV